MVNSSAFRKSDSRFRLSVINIVGLGVMIVSIGHPHATRGAALKADLGASTARAESGVSRRNWADFHDSRRVGRMPRLRPHSLQPQPAAAKAGGYDRCVCTLCAPAMLPYRAGGRRGKRPAVQGRCVSLCFCAPHRKLEVVQPSIRPRHNCSSCGAVPMRLRRCRQQLVCFLSEGAGTATRRCAPRCTRSLSFGSSALSRPSGLGHARARA